MIVMTTQKYAVGDRVALVALEGRIGTVEEIKVIEPSCLHGSGCPKHVHDNHLAPYQRLYMVMDDGGRADCSAHLVTRVCTIDRPCESCQRVQAKMCACNLETGIFNHTAAGVCEGVKSATSGAFAGSAR